MQIPQAIGPDECDGLCKIDKVSVTRLSVPIPNGFMNH